MTSFIPYLLYFIPLILSVLVYFLDGKRFISNVSYLILFIIIIMSLKLFGSIDNNTIIVNSSKNINIIGTEFRLNTFNIFFLINIMFANFIGFMNYIKDLVLTKKKSINYIKHFFSIYFLYIFSIIGILLTDNIFHLFIFLEIYSFSNYIIVTNYDDKNLNILSYKYFSNNIFGSLLNMLSVFYMLVYFNTSSILSIKQQLLTIPLNERYDVFLIMILFLFSIIIRFFTNSVSKYHDTDYSGVNFISISNIFVNSLLGIFLLSNVIFYILPTSKIFELFFIDKIVIFLSSIAIIYNSVLLFNEKYNYSIFNIFIRLNLISLFYVIISIFLDNNINVFSNYIIDFLYTSLLLYFFSNFISLKYNDNNIDILNANIYIKIFFVIILLYKLYIPIFSSATINNTFILTIIKENYYYLFIPFLINKIAILFNIFNVISDKNIINDLKISNSSKTLTTIVSIFLIICFMVFLSIYF